MTLEDFFTLTEMKGGLTAPARVKELVAVMQKEKDGLVKNAGDATRQWAAVASTIVATENKECLDLFIQLDGLWFIDRWLKVSQTFKNEASDCFVEEAISSLLQAVEKLQLDSERLNSSGICITVKSLLNNESAKVQHKARALVDSWKAKDVDTKSVDVENAASCDVQISEHAGSQSIATYAPATRPYVGGAEIENDGSAKVQDMANTLFDSWKLEDVDMESVDVENAPCSDVKKQICEHPDSQSIATDAPGVRSHADQTSGGAEIRNAAFDVMERISERPEPRSAVTDVPALRPHVDHTSGVAQVENLKLLNDKDNPCVTPNCANSEDGVPDAVASLVKLDSVVGNLSMSEDLCHSAESVDPALLAAPKLGSVEVTLEMVKSEHAREDARHDKKLEFCADSGGEFEVPSSFGTFGWREVSSGSDMKAAEEVAPKPDEVAHDGIETTSFLNKNLPANDSTYEMDDGRCLEQKNSEQGDGSALEETQELATTLSPMEEVAKGDEVDRRHRKSKKKRFGKNKKFARLAKHSGSSDIIRQTVDMGLEDGTFDALEVARLVAKEVEREVGDYDEHSGSSASTSSSSSFSSSSSEGHSSSGIRQPNSSDSINGERELQSDGPINKLQPRDIESFQASKNEALIGSTNRETNLDNHMQDMESSQVTDVVPEPESHTEKSFLEFDLNQEFSSEDLDHQYVDTISNPVSVVSASRAVVTSGMPAGPLKFEGSLGWKGSAATSAFRPASPRRASDSDKALSGGGTSSDSRQRPDFLDIDLNITEGGEDMIVSNVSGKQKQVLPGLLSGESSVELSPKRSEMLKFDLNQTEEGGGVVASEWMMGGRSFGPQRCRRSPSPASSSCMQPSARNFDLNDNPSNSNDPSNMYSFLGESSSHKVDSYVRQDDAVISILGTKVKKSSFPTQPLLSFPNGRTSEPVMDANLLRGGPLMGLGPAVPCPQSVYGYNGVAMSPTMSFSSAPMYGPAGSIPYMFDSREAPFVPQIVGPASTVQSSYYQPSLAINMMSAPPAANVAGPFRPTLDMNAGFAVEAGNRDPSFLRQLFVPGQGRPLDDQLRDGFIPLSAGSSGGKRKEPDSGWELYPNNIKHHQSPHL